VLATQPLVVTVKIWQNEAKIINVFKAPAGQIRGALTAARTMHTVQLVTAITAAMSLDPAVRLLRVLARGDGHRRWHHTDGLQHAKPGHVPTGGDRWQARLLHPNPALDGEPDGRAGSANTIPYIRIVARSCCAR
jgi:hypothetical protein